MTILPPSAEDVLSHLRAQVDDLARELADGANGGDQGVLLKQRIFLLHRLVEQHVQVIESLQGDVRRLVDGWKGRFATNGAGAPATPTSATPVVAASGAAVRAQSGDMAPVVSPPAAGTGGAVAVQPSLPTPVDIRPGPSAPVAGQPRVIDELNASTFVEKGWGRIATGDFVGAEAALDKALALNPGDPNAETLRGWAQMGQGKLDTAMAIFEQVLERVPDHALALVNVGCIYLRRGEHARAMEHLTTAIAFDSDRKAMLYAYYYMGLVQFGQEEYAQAIGALLRAIELGPNMIEARFELGRVYWFADRTDDAIATWRRGAELNKFNPWSARCRDLLLTIADGGAPSRVG